jgi:hypothetical protein
MPTQTTTAQVLLKWSQTFPETGLPCASLGAAWILLQIIRRSRIILTDKSQLLAGLVNALPFAESRTVVPSPLWTSEADWKEALAFIIEDTNVPRVLVVLDFDVALQEAYLVPALTAWVSSVQIRCSNRIVLIPSDVDLTEVSPRVLEFATVLTRNAPYLPELDRLGEMMDRPMILDVPQTASGVMGYARAASISTEDELRRIAVNCGASIPTRVLENFVTLYDGLRGALGSRDAGRIAEHAALLPWIERARGETVSRAVSAALKMVLNAG